MDHIINKQIFDVKLSKKLDAFKAQHLLSQYYWSYLLPVIEKAFNELSSKETVIQIDSLEIDLGVLLIKHIEHNELDRSVSEAIITQLKKGVLRHSGTYPVKHASTLIHVSRQWLYYMQHGSLSWNTLKVSESWYQQVLEAFAVDYGSVSELRHLIGADRNVAKRIVYDHPVNFVIKLIEIITAKKQDQLERIIEELNEIRNFINRRMPEFGIIDERSLRNRLWEHAVRLAARGKQMSVSNLPPMVLPELIKDAIIAKAVNERLLSKLNLTLAAIKQLTEKLEQELYEERIYIKTKELPPEPSEIESENPIELAKSPTEKKPEVSGEQGTIDKDINISEITEEKKQSSKAEKEENINFSEQKTETAISESIERKIESSTLPEEERADAGEQETIARENTVSEIEDENKDDFFNPDLTDALPDVPVQIDKDGIFVQHAGIVLLHSFLPAFFRTLQLVESGKFLSITAQQKAIHLLHFLATGLQQPKEYELVMPKILCSYPIRMPLANDIQISDDEISEAINLLEVVIEQWEILKNTSVSGLREGFLIRNGKLSNTNNKLVLQVESNSIDVLLNRFPWNLSIIKLPWKKELLWVEWR